MKVAFAKTARADLRRITVHLIKENPRAARAIVDDLETKAFDIASFPNRFEAFAVRGGIELRRRVVGRYLILYQVEADRIEVVNVFHGARDIARILSIRSR